MSRTFHLSVNIRGMLSWKDRDLRTALATAERERDEARGRLQSVKGFAESHGIMAGTPLGAWLANLATPAPAPQQEAEHA